MNSLQNALQHLKLTATVLFFFFFFLFFFLLLLLLLPSYDSISIY